MKTWPRPSWEGLFRSEDAPAERVRRVWKFRVARGRGVMVVLSISSPVAGLVVSMVAISAETVTSVLVDVTDRIAVMVVVSVMRTSMPGNFVVAKPEALI